MSRRTSKIFLDTSVILAAFGSENGGSSMIINHQGKRFVCITSVDVVIEVFSKAEKLKTTEQLIEKWIISKKILVTQSPTHSQKAKFNQVIIDQKDRHVLAGAVKNKANILLSLDRKHIVTSKVIEALKPIRILTPKQFLQQKPI